MPDSALLKLVTTANSLLIGVLALMALACLAALLVVLCLAAIRLRRLLRPQRLTGEIMTVEAPDIIDGVFVDAGALAPRQPVSTRC
jgi:hypothetical protein